MVSHFQLPFYLYISLPVHHEIKSKRIKEVSVEMVAIPYSFMSIVVTKTSGHVHVML